MITIVGMGLDVNDVTLRGAAACKSGRPVYVRTAKTAAAKTLGKLGVDYVSCDDLYDQAADFDGLLAAIAGRLVASGDAVYCVDGAGVEDAVVELLSSQCEVEIVPGVSHVAAALAAAGVVAERAEYLSALQLTIAPTFLAPQCTLVLTELDDKVLAGEVKLKLLDTYGDVEGYFVSKGKATKVSVADLDRQKGYGYQCCYVLPYLPFLQKQRHNFEDVVYLLARLRAPDGCEWDKAQTHQSIRANCIEEAYELVEAIDLDDTDKMLEETGDVLLQAVFHASMAEDAGEFTVADVLSALCTKLISRHPHVFGNVHAANAEEALAAWDSAKAVEKNQTTYTQKLRMVAPMPALMRSKKVQKIAAKAHYDFDSVEQAASKVDEELAELLAAATDEERVMEGGDLLFSVVNVLRWLHVEPELALLQSTAKFVERFAAVEEALAAMGKRIDEVSVDELWATYDRIKGVKP